MATHPSDVDTVLIEMLEEDLLDIMLTPPRVPSFLAETVRPGAAS